MSCPLNVVCTIMVQRGKFPGLLVTLSPFFAAPPSGKMFQNLDLLLFNTITKPIEIRPVSIIGSVLMDRSKEYLSLK